MKFINQTRGKELEDAISGLKNKEILLIENTRFEDLEDKKIGLELIKEIGLLLNK